MKLDCLACLAEVQKMHRHAKQAQADLADNGKDTNSLMLMQFHEGQINVLARLEKFMQKGLNHE